MGIIGILYLTSEPKFCEDIPVANPKTILNNRQYITIPFPKIPLKNLNMPTLKNILREINKTKRLSMAAIIIIKFLVSHKYGLNNVTLTAAGIFLINPVRDGSIGPKSYDDPASSFERFADNDNAVSTTDSSAYLFNSSDINCRPKKIPKPLKIMRNGVNTTLKIEFLMLSL